MHEVPLEVYEELEQATPEQRRAIILRLIEEHPRGRLELPERDGVRADLSLVDLSRDALREIKTRSGLDSPAWWNPMLGGANLGRADLTRVSLLGARSIERISLHRATLDHTQLRRRQLGGPIGEEEAEQWFEAKETYLALKNHWEQTGRYDDASWAYRKERRMEKATKAPWRCRKYFGDEKPFLSSMRRLLGDLSPGIYKGLPRWSPLVWWFWLKYMVKWLADWFVELLCDYGESTGLVLFWMAASLLGFAAYYWRVGGIRLTDPASGSQSTATSFLHYLIYSAGAFTTTIFAKYQPACDQVRLVTALQAIVGIFLAGLLGFVAGNRIRRS